MFDRGLNSGHQQEKSRIAAQLTLASGETLVAQIMGNTTGKLLDTLNRPEPFIEVEMTDGTSRVIARQTILGATAIAAPKADELQRAQRGWAFDPCAVLGVPANATAEEIRSAYMQRVKSYHPDRFVSLNLPKEVEDYAASMLQRINTAYQALQPKNNEAAEAA
jgi:DnaJ-domain-containing protein 1